MSPAETFMAVSNATAAIVERAPAFITYHVHGSYRVRDGNTIDKTVTVRTDDGIAIVHDDKTGQDIVRTPFPASPTFDALSTFDLDEDWTMGFNTSTRDFDLGVKNVHPLHYIFAKTNADAVAFTVRGYVVSLAPDSTPQLGHLHLERANAMHDDRWLSDVWYDPATLIPSRVVWTGTNAMDLDARYVVVEGVWLLKSISLSYLINAPAWLGRVRVNFAGDLSGYAFSPTPPDPRLPAAP